MDIQLKHIKFYRQLSKETLCFSAKVYVDNKCIGTCENKGEGGMSTYALSNYFDKKSKQLLSEIEDYFIQMPDVTRKIPKEIDPSENSYTVKMSFTEWIDMQVDEAWIKKEEQRVKHLEEKHQQRLNRKQII